MKRIERFLPYLFVLLLVFMATSEYNDYWKPAHRQFEIKQVNSVTWHIQGTEGKWSYPYETNSTMSAFCTAWDSLDVADLDSIKIKISAYVSDQQHTGYIFAGSVTLTDTTRAAFNLTGSTIPCGKWHKYYVEGLTGNRTETATRVDIDYNGCF